MISIFVNQNRCGSTLTYELKINVVAGKNKGGLEREDSGHASSPFVSVG
jgi:hypothetical protein